MKILITEISGYSEETLNLYRDVGDIMPTNLRDDELISALPEVEILVVRLLYFFDAELLKAAKKLKYIVTPTTGLNHIDLAYCEANGIRVVSLKGEKKFLNNITPTAELTWGLLLALIRKLPAAFDSVLNGSWDRDLFLGTELKGKTLGIIGFGRLGKMVAKYGAAFGMNVVYSDIDEFESVLFAKPIELMELLTTSDVISLHIPLEHSTQGFFGEAEIKSMKEGAILINTSRGEVLNEDALLQALSSKHLSGAALDVLQGEVSADSISFKKNKLIDYAKKNQNLLITPHIGGACPDSMRLTEGFVAKKLISLLEDTN